MDKQFSYGKFPNCSYLQDSTENSEFVETKGRFALYTYEYITYHIVHISSGMIIAIFDDYTSGKKYLQWCDKYCIEESFIDNNSSFMYRHLMRKTLKGLTAHPLEQCIDVLIDV